MPMSIAGPNLKNPEILKVCQSIIESVPMGRDETFIEFFAKLEPAGALEGLKEVAVAGSRSALADETLQKPASACGGIHHASDSEFDPVIIPPDRALFAEALYAAK